MTSTYVRPGDGTHYPMIDGDHVAKAAVAGAFEVFEVAAPAAPAAPPHVAPWTAVLYVLDGALTAWIDGETHEVERGGLVTIPAGTPCTFTVKDESARFLVVTSGDAASRFFADFADSVRPDAPFVESMEAIEAVTARHGVAVTRA